MTTPTNQWKLGLFVVVSLAATIGTIVFFGERSLRKETVAYKTYFDESVQGLEIGAPVKFRGVSIGSVSDISLAGDRRHVEITIELGVKVLNSLGLAAKKVRGAGTKLVIPADLRVQLGSSGITGVKFMQMDFFDPVTNPPRTLPFAVPENYIPTIPSMMKNVEDSVVLAVDRVPEVARQMVLVLAHVNAMFTEVERLGLPEKIAVVVAQLSKVLDQIGTAVAALDTGGLSRDGQATMKNLNGAIASLKLILGRIDGEKGLAVSVQRTSDALGGLAQNATHVGPAMEDTLRDLQGAARSVQRLADAIELDPDMLIKGRTKRAGR